MLVGLGTPKRVGYYDSCTSAGNSYVLVGARIVLVIVGLMSFCLAIYSFAVPQVVGSIGGLSAAQLILKRFYTLLALVFGAQAAFCFTFAWDYQNPKARNISLFAGSLQFCSLFLFSLFLEGYLRIRSETVLLEFIAGIGMVLFIVGLIIRRITSSSIIIDRNIFLQFLGCLSFFIYCLYQSHRFELNDIEILYFIFGLLCLGLYFHSSGSRFGNIIWGVFVVSFLLCFFAGLLDPNILGYVYGKRSEVMLLFGGFLVLFHTPEKRHFVEDSYL